MNQQKIALFTLIEGNRMSVAVIAAAIKLDAQGDGQLPLSHLAIGTGDEIIDWLINLPKDLQPVPIFDRVPRTGMTAQRHFRFVSRGDDASHKFPVWVPTDLRTGVKVYTNCDPRACALQVLQDFLRWRPGQAQQPKKRSIPGLPHFRRESPSLAPDPQ